MVCADLTPSARSTVPEEAAIDTVDLIHQNGGRAIFVKTDVGDAKAIEHMVNTAVAVFGRLDMLVPESNDHSPRISLAHGLFSWPILCFSRYLLTAGSIVNNAGVSLESRFPNPIHTTSEQVWDETMRVNARSVFLGCKYALAQMLKQDSVHPSGDKGWIINISSIMASIAGNDNRGLLQCSG